HLEATGRIDNFRRAAGQQDGPFQGLYFNDSDVYKWLEAASWSLATDPDPELERLVDETIAAVAAAQQPDGYLDTYYILGDEAGRWTELVRTHELYCAGHLFQAAVAHHRATGKCSLLDVARRFADYICDVLGPAEDGKRPGTDGHEEIELAMVELARETGERRYLEQARYFLDARGYGLAGGDEYHQDHKPFRELDAMVGHAVRAVYLNAGAADIYAETGEPALLAALERLWRNMTTRRIYVSGGIGSRYEGEAFGRDFELPNARAYTETCAAIGSVMWAWRMLLLTGEARFADLMEQTLYNAVLPGVSLDGQFYYYQNPLEDDGHHRRQPWFHCACCPPNVARLLSSLPGYVYTVTDDEVWVHLYAEGAATLS
ncbi:MAG: glycoside hydrolase family 127 protein, partial [Dehalococcoidia bacterium]